MNLVYFNVLVKNSYKLLRVSIKIVTVLETIIQLQPDILKCKFNL